MTTSRKQMAAALLAFALAVPIALGAAGCGGSPGNSSTGVDPNSAEVSPAGDIPDNQAFVPYSPPGAGITVDVPEGWSRSVGGGQTTFTDKLNAIKIEVSRASSAPTLDEARGPLADGLANSVPGYRAGDVTAVTRKSGEGILTTYLASSTPDPVTGKVSEDAVERYLFFKDGKLVTLTLTGPNGADNVDPWRIVTDSLRFGG